LLEATLRASLRLVIVCGLLCLASFLADWTFDIPLTARRVGAVAIAVGWLALGVHEFSRRRRQLPSLEALAKRVEERWPTARGLLVSAYEWRAAPAGDAPVGRDAPVGDAPVDDARVGDARVGGPSGGQLWRGVSIELIGEVRRQADEATRQLAFRQLFPEFSRRRLVARAAAFLSVAAILATSISGTEAGRVWFARNWRFASIDYPRRTELALEGLINGELVVPRGGVAEATIRIARRTADDTRSGPIPATPLPTPAVEFRPVRAHSLRPSPTRSPAPSASWHRLAVRDVLEPFAFQVRADDAKSDWIAVRLVDAPRLDSLELSVVEPSYAGGVTVALPPGQGPYRVLRGSELRIAGRVSKALRAARVLTGQREIPLELKAGGFRGAIPAAELTEGLLSFSVRDEHGLDFARPPTVRLEWLPDEPPAVAVAWIGASRLVVVGGAMEARVDVRDDRQVAGLRLLARVAAPGGDAMAQPWNAWPRTITTTTEWPVSGAASVTETVRWEPASAPVGSVITLAYEATDNDTVSGPKSTRSAEKSLRVVEPAELRADWLRREKETRQLVEQLVDDLVAWGRETLEPTPTPTTAPLPTPSTSLMPATPPTPTTTTPPTTPPTPTPSKTPADEPPATSPPTVEVEAENATPLTERERERQREREQERQLDRYRSYRLAVSEHLAGLTAIWQEMRFSGLEPSNKSASPAASAAAGTTAGMGMSSATGTPAGKTSAMSAAKSAAKSSASDRLFERVLAPLEEVYARRMPPVIDGFQADEKTSELGAKHALVIDGLREVVRELARAEGFQEAVRLVEELQDGQRAVLAETLEAERRRVRELLERPKP
jgi:outer membrane biosynthesis protein TonB